jgi:hypothetical protein
MSWEKLSQWADRLADSIHTRAAASQASQASASAKQRAIQAGQPGLAQQGQTRDAQAWDAQAWDAQQQRQQQQHAWDAQAEELTEELATAAIYADSPYARMWYLMRERGEHDRANTLHALYTRRNTPGGPYPDPRGPAAFSPRAIVAATARAMGLTIWPVPPDQEGAHTVAMRGHAAWLITYPPDEPHQPPQKPTIAVLQLADETLMLWFVSCMLGYLALEPSRLHDPAIPPGPMTMPTDSLQLALIHRYAHALMLVEFDCSTAFGCPCARIAAQLNAAPPDHPQPTLTMPTISCVTPVVSDVARTPKTPNPKRPFGNSGNSGVQRSANPPAPDE